MKQRLLKNFGLQGAQAHVLLTPPHWQEGMGAVGQEQLWLRDVERFGAHKGSPIKATGWAGPKWQSEMAKRRELALS
jgi:hypothetical protein